MTTRWLDQDVLLYTRLWIVWRLMSHILNLTARSVAVHSESKVAHQDIRSKPTAENKTAFTSSHVFGAELLPIRLALGVPEQAISALQQRSATARRGHSTCQPRCRREPGL